jgi:hypothetical protein
MSSPTNPSRPVLVAGFLLGIAIGGACVAVGFWLGRSAPGPTPERIALSPEPPRANANPEDLVDEIRRLHEAIDRLVISPPVASPSERSVAASPTNGIAELKRSIDELRLVTARTTSNSTASSNSTPRLPRSDLMPRLARELAARPENFEDDDALIKSWRHWFDDKSAQLTQSHLLWTLDDVLAEYGRPRTASPQSSGIYLEYSLGVSDSRDLFLSFTLASGRVVQVQVWDNEKPK